MPKALFRTLRWGLAGIAGLLVIAVVAVELMPWNFLKAPITERVEAATGRQLEIRGDVSLSLLPRPHIELEQLAFANTTWAQVPVMATIRNLELTPSMTSLLSGDLVLDDIHAENPVLHLEGRDQQPGNWVMPAMTAAGEDGDQNPQNGDDNGPPITIRQFSATQAEIRYLAPGADIPRVLSLPSLTISGNSLALEAVVRTGTGNEGQGLPVSLSAGYQAGTGNGQWRLNDLQARINDIGLSGHLRLDTGSGPPSLEGKLHSPSVNVPQFLAAMPKPPEPSDKGGLSVPVLPVMAGDLQLTVDQVILQPATLDSVKANIDLARHRLILDNLTFDVVGGQIEATASLTSSPEFITAEVKARGREMDLHPLGMGQKAGHILDAELDLSLDRIAQSPSLDTGKLLDNLVIAKAQASYQTADKVAGPASDLDFALDRSGERSAPVLSVAGRFQGKPLELTIEGAPLPQLRDGLEAYPLQAQAQSGELSAWADTRLGAILSPGTFAGQLVLRGTDGRDLERWIGPVLPPLPDYRISGHLSRDNQRWSATDLDGHVGVTEVAGEVHYTHADRPRVNIDLDAGRIELARFIADNGESGAATSGDESAVNESPVSALREFDGQLALQAETLVLPNKSELANLDVVASLQEGKLAISPLSFTIGGGSWDSSLKLDATDQPASGTIKAQFDAISLSRVGDTFTAIEDRLGRLSGQLDVEITGASPGGQQEDGVLLPFVGRLAFEPSTLQFSDSETATDMTLSLQTRGLDAGEQTFHIDGEGQYDGAPFSLTFRGAPLLDARDPDRPYTLDLSSDIVDSRIEIRGAILRPLALKGLDLRLHLEGPNPHRLTRLLGLPLPELPRYSVSGDLTLENERWAFTNLAGEIGNSDVGGQIFFDTGSRPPQLSAELNSRSLELEDLGGLVGKDPESSGTNGAADASGDRFVLPDDPLLSDNWRKLNADVRYRGKSVRAADIPLSDVVIDFSLNDGQAVFDPVRFGVGDGRVDFNLDLDVKPDQPEGTMQLEVRAVDLNKALREWPIAEGSVGTIGGQGKFWVTGSSVAGLLGSADGGVVLLMTQGKLNALLVELAGLDASQSFLSWLGGRDPLPIDCAYMDLQTRDGVVDLDTFAVDTSDTTFTGTGTVNMNNERLDITIEAHPKDPSVLSARTPLHLGGTFNNVDPGLEKGELALRAGGSALLAAVAAPVAALVPLLDLGAGDEVPYCDGLASRSREAIDNQEDGSDGADNDES
ncbi:AsmA family protein [Marinobacter lacisalsi]|uniref:AsmA family protein n=1 Tax=Marinobacter lacisalsi TaxID=475979 RepID=A0ABV8QGC6_9GAMM